MSLFYLKFLFIISGSYFERLVREPFDIRFLFSYTWRIFRINVRDGNRINNGGDTREMIDILRGSFTIFRQYYRHTDTYSEIVMFTALMSIIHYVMSLITGNYSQVDRAWSILPVIHAWHYCYHDYLNRGAVHPRLFLAAFLITLWGWRLTLNFARKGGYSWGGQDYRYPYIKAKIGPVAMGFLNLFVINIFQNALLALLTTPLWFTLLTYIPEWEAKLNWMDLGISVLFLSFLLIEGIADEQQYKFQTEKHALLKHVPRDQLTGDYRRGFLTTGLFRYSRHANFCAEMGIWWTVYLFSLNSMWTLYRDIEEPMNMLDPRSYINWTICGPVVLTMLFQGSTWLTETISAEKYPDYASYMASVSRIIPWKPRSPLPPSKETKEA